jgi:hypothetical protein
VTPVTQPGEDRGPIDRFCLAAGGGFWLHRPGTGVIQRLDAQGKVVTTIEGLRHVPAMAIDHQGDLLVIAPLDSRVLRFSPAGALLQSYTDDGTLSVVGDASGNPYGVKIEGRQVVICRYVGKMGSQKLVTLPLDAEAGPTTQYSLAQIIGADPIGNLYVLLEACDDQHVIRRHRLVKVSSTGSVLKTVDLYPLCFSPSMPPHFAVPAQDRVLTYTVSEQQYLIVAWSLR